MGACVLKCLRAVPWWVWVALTVAGAVCGLVTAIVSALTAGTAIALVPLLWGAAGGVLSAYASTIINCVSRCKS